MYSSRPFNFFYDFITFTSRNIYDMAQNMKYIQEQEQERSPGYILPTPLQFIYTTRSYRPRVTIILD